jgi:hypothetical protein
MMVAVLYPTGADGTWSDLNFQWRENNGDKKTSNRDRLTVVAVAIGVSDVIPLAAHVTT